MNNNMKKYGLLALKIITGLAFLAAGTAKLLGAEMMVGTFEAIGIGQWFRYLTGVIEVGSAILLFVSGKQAIGAGLLVCTMIGAILSLGTVFTTSMIYAQLKTVPRWYMPLTSPLFMALSITGGALLAGQVSYAIPFLIISAGIQIAYWIMGDKRLAASGTTMETATGLGHIGKVKAFEPPHTGSNYLMREFIHVVGRKHAMKLRIIALGLGFLIPVIALLLPFGHVLALIAVLSHVAGILVSRWLFFAQAEHVVGLYSGKR